MSPPDLLAEALALAARGFHVFPLHYPIWAAGAAQASCSCGKPACLSVGKHPLSRNGEKDATTDPEQIQAWWGKWPQANIGLATGPSDLCVLDLDGPEAFDELMAAAGVEVIPPTLAATTGRGVHLIYQRLGARIVSVQRKGAKLGTRASTGYVVAPPSLHASGARYAWVDVSVLIAPVPAWVAAFAGGQRTGNAAELPICSPSVADSPRLHKQELIGHQTVGLPRLADMALDGLGGGEPYSLAEATRLASALAMVPADLDGRTWASWGRALYDLEWVIRGEPSPYTGGGLIDVGLEIWDAWSRTCEAKYRGRQDLVNRWNSFERHSTEPYKGPRVTVASIYKQARLKGWNDLGNGAVTRPFGVDIKHNKEGNAGYINGMAALPEGMRGVAEAIVWPDKDKVGRPLATCANARQALERLGVHCDYDVFHDRMHVEGAPIGEWTGELSDHAVHALRVVIKQQYGFDAGTAGTHDAAMQVALQHSYDPILDYLDEIAWDGQARLETWLADYLGAERTALNAEIGKLALVAAVRRARKPGTKFDQVIVLESPEGFGKSEAVEILAGSNNFSDQTVLTLDDKGQQEALKGIWLYEIADLAGISRADVEKIKAFASRTVDRARPAYGRTRVDRPRRCIFFASTNSDWYLQSQTGNRRFWPVSVRKIDKEKLRADRDQIWAEAAAIEARGAPITLAEKFWSVVGALQDERREHDPWDDVLGNMEQHQAVKKATHDVHDELRISTRDVLDLVLRLPVERQTHVTAKRMAFSLRRLGWDGPKVIRFEHGVSRGWTKRA